jgi:hypothetical protein
MTQDEVEAIPRKTARQVMASVPAGRGYDDRLLLAVEQAMNLEWWRGYHAALRSRTTQTGVNLNQRNEHGACRIQNVAQGRQMQMSPTLG